MRLKQLPCWRDADIGRTARGVFMVHQSPRPSMSTGLANTILVRRPC